MLVSIESGLVYCLITSKSPNFYDFMNNKFNILKNHNKNTIVEPTQEDNDFVKVIDELNDLGESNTDTQSLNETKTSDQQIIEMRTKNVEGQLGSIRSKSYYEGMVALNEMQHF